MFKEEDLLTLLLYSQLEIHNMGQDSIILYYNIFILYQWDKYGKGEKTQHYLDGIFV